MTLLMIGMGMAAVLAVFAGLHHDGAFAATALAVDLRYPLSPIGKVTAPLALLIGVTLHVLSGSLRITTFATGAASILTHVAAERLSLAVAGDVKEPKQIEEARI
jgi:hypothetical protein